MCSTEKRENTVNPLRKIFSKKSKIVYYFSDTMYG